MKKYACVTGTDRGVGYELTRKLLLEDFIVFAGVLKEDGEIAELKKEFENSLHIIKLDISRDTSVSEAAKYIAKTTSSIDILINNGAILGSIDTTVFDAIDFDEINRVFNVNAVGAVRVSNALVQLVMNSESKLIINISSEAGSIGDCNRRGWFSYCMSKAALNMASNILHNSLWELGGQVLVIHPGHVKSYMRGTLDTTGMLTPEESADHILTRIKEHKKYYEEKAAYIDYLGNRMEW
jgi:NAD(P)-dependent dehydrogenase (short-subunit alcohol dehydrogenase family)